MTAKARVRMLVLLVGTACTAAVLAAPVRDGRYEQGTPCVDIRLSGEPDVELVSPSGKRMIWNASGVTAREIPGAVTHLLSVDVVDTSRAIAPEVLVSLERPEGGRWLVGAGVRDSAVVGLAVQRYVAGVGACMAGDTVVVGAGQSRWWCVTWSRAASGSGCWVRIKRLAWRRPLDADGKKPRHASPRENHAE